MIGLFFGSTNGNTAAVAEIIKQEFHHQGNVEVELFDVADYYLEEMLAFDFLIAGVPTWNIGQLQRDWEAVLDELDSLDLSGKVAAFYGLGDQVGYPDTFGDALFFVADRIQQRGAKVVGAWPTEGYSFRGSWAEQDGHFIGLMIDEDNQSEETPSRVQQWVRQLLLEFGINSNEPTP
jgi:flavodoxin I